MSAFKRLCTDFINGGGRADAISKDMRKQMLKVYVKESNPHFLVSDSHFFVPAYFTPEAVAAFRAKFPNVSVDALQGKVILISKWNLELRKVDSNQVWTSYAGLEVRLIVSEFKPQLGERITPSRYPSNLYRDDEFKTTIQRFRFAQAQSAAAASKAAMAPVGGNKSGNVSGGVVAVDGDGWSFKSGSTKTVSLRRASSPKKAPTPSPAKASGAKAKGKAAGKASKPKSATKAAAIAKFTPGGNKAKKSVSKKHAGKKTSGKASKGTTDMTTMAQYQKLLQAANKKKK